MTYCQLTQSYYAGLSTQCDDVIQPYGAGRATQVGIHMLRAWVVDGARDDDTARVAVRVHDIDTVLGVVERPPRDLFELLIAEQHHSAEVLRVEHRGAAYDFWILKF